MTVEKTITISRLDILEHFISIAENCSVAEVRKKINDVKVITVISENEDLISIKIIL